MIVPLGHVFILAGIIFSLGLVCTVAHRNLIMTLVAVEVMMNTGQPSPSWGRPCAGSGWRAKPSCSSSSRWLRSRSPWDWRWSSACIDGPAPSIRTVTTF